MQIRTGCSDDVNAVVEIWRHHGGPTRSPGAQDDARRLLERDAGALIVAVDGTSRVVGSLIVGWDGWRCHLYRLVVDPGARRTGVASALVVEARARATAVGARRIDAMVHR